MVEHEDIDLKFANVPRARLPFPAVLAASRNDTYCTYLEAEEWAHAWGADFSDAGDSGHINTDSGHGPWPEGLMRFAGFLGKL
jgi:predicted alpha/beta hydrolase family esterase